MSVMNKKKPIARIISKNLVIQELVKIPTSLDEYKLPAELSHCCELQSWAKESSGKTHDVAALMTTISIASASTAGKVYTETYAPTSLYTVLILKTGGGKDILTKIPAKLIPSCVEVGRVTSVGALEDLVCSSSAIMHIYDEYGDLLGSILLEGNSSKKDLLAIQKILYSCGNGDYQTMRYSSQGGKYEIEPRIVKNPAYGICGLTTERQLIDKLKPSMLSDGFLNRFIIVNGSEISPNFIDSPISTTPPSITEHIERIKNIKSKIIIPMEEDTKVYYTKVIGDADLPETDISIWVNGEELKREISVRWRENSLRLATALAAYEQFSTLPLWLLQWSYSFVKFNSVKFLQKFEDKDNQSVHTATIDVVKKWFKKQDEEWIPLHIIANNATRLCSMKGKDRRDILNDMVEREILIEKKVGRTIFYSLI